MNIIQRSAALFGEIMVVVADNRTKSYLFTAEERLELVSALVKSWKNVSAALCRGLLVDFLREQGISLLVRGVRGGDFSCEYELSTVNKTLNPEIETVFLAMDPQYLAIRSSIVRELASFGGNTSAMVSPAVESALRKKFPLVYPSLPRFIDGI